MIVDNMMNFLFPLLSMMHMDRSNFVVDNYNIETFDIPIEKYKMLILLCSNMIYLLDKDIDNVVFEDDYTFVA
jgi:hypothetical protein